MKYFILVLILFQAQISFTQELVFPPKINLFKHNISQYPYYLYLPDARIWGWSNNGKIALSIETEIAGHGGQRIDFVIFDLISNETIFELIMSSTDIGEFGDIEDETLYNIFKVDISNALKMHNIINQRTDFFQFPIIRNYIVYDINIIDAKYRHDPEASFRFDADVVTKYTVQVTANNGKKNIGNFTPRSSLTRNMHVCGYFLSPFDENKVLVVITEVSQEFEGLGLTYRFSGFHMGEGFN
jgi:hypothetical protein